MTRKMYERSISTLANIFLADGHGQEFDTYRELVFQENKDGSWIVYVVRPGATESDESGKAMVSGSIKVSEAPTKAFLVELFSLLADPGAFKDVSGAE